jgi:hypothetical protein
LGRPNNVPRRSIIVVIVLIILGSAGYAAPVIPGYAPGECTVSVAGTAFNLEVSGVGARARAPKPNRPVSV